MTERRESFQSENLQVNSELLGGEDVEGGSVKRPEALPVPLGQLGFHLLVLVMLQDASHINHWHSRGLLSGGQSSFVDVVIGYRI